MTNKEEIYAAYVMQKDSFNYLQNLLIKEGVILDDVRLPVTDKTIKPEKIVQLVEEVFSTDIKANNRKQKTIFGRQAAAYMLRMYTRLSLSEITSYIGVKDHTTVLYSITKCRDIMKTEYWYKEKIEQLCEEMDKYALYLSSK
jgi:chromosomal replication initiation ATPase DnaA